jgi:hypothetical protein
MIIMFFYFSGYYLGIITYHTELNEKSETKYSEKITKQLNKIKSLIDTFPRNNSEEHDILYMLEIIRAQYKKACAMLKITSANPYDANISF